MSEYNIKTDYTLCERESPFLYAHPDHAITVSIADDLYKESHRTNVRWDFGDGYVVEAPEATHAYNTGGYYTIKATLYGTDGTVYTNKVAEKQILVKSLIPTKLNFILSDKTWNKRNDYFISKNLFLGELQVNLDSDIVSEPNIVAHRRMYDDFNQKNYFQIKDEPYYHLNRYFTFLEEDSLFNPDLSASFIKILKPVQKYTPSYLRIFARLSNGNTIPTVEFFYLNDTQLSKNDITLDLFTNINGTTKPVKCTFCSNEADIPSGSKECGRVGFINIWYKNDYESSNELIFDFEKASLKFNNESSLKESYLNTAPLGFTFNTVDPILINDNKSYVIKALTNNGLYNNLTDEAYLIDTYLKHNFYKDYSVGGYYSCFIENDFLDKKTYNMLKSKRFNKNAFSLTADNKKCIITPEESDAADNVYYKKFTFKPLAPFDIIDNGEIIYSCNQLVDLSEIKLPTEKQHNENLDEVLSAYMLHPMFEDTPALKTFLKESLGNNGLFDRILNKGNNFIDDHNNIKTCYINNLLSIYSMLDSSINDYNLSSFEKINELKDLMRILSMNYSTLFGNVITDDYDIRINHMSAGRNVGEKLEKDDILLCDKDYKLIGFKREGIVYQLKVPTTYIIVKDDFSFRTHLVSFYGIESPIVELFEDQTDDWRNKNKEFIDKVNFVYNLDDYSYKWGWGLNLPNETTFINKKSDFIDNYYSFYIFNTETIKTRKYNFLEESSIPLDNNGNQLSVEDWNSKFGFTYDCLMKVLCEKLNDIK